VTEISISPPRGRPFLSWVGKKPLDFIKAFPAQLVEVFDPTRKARKIHPSEFSASLDNWQNALFHGDNKEVLGFLLTRRLRGKVKLIYIDPPFDSGANYIRETVLRGMKEDIELGGEDYSLGEQIQYYDIWNNDAYLQFMFERLLLLKELLEEKGSIFVHVDYRRVHQIRLIMDEIFGPQNFRNEVQVRRTAKHTAMQFEQVKTLQVASDTILIYAKTSETEFNKAYREASEQQKQGNWHGFSDNLYRPTMRYKLFDMLPPSPRGRWLWEKSRADLAVENYRLFERALAKGEVSSFEQYAQLHPEMEFVRHNKGSPQYWISAREEIMVDTNWSDIQAYSHVTDYPTEKSEKLMRRIIEMGSVPGDLVLDCFCGSGTTAVVAQVTGRRWICADINKGAITTTIKRVQRIITKRWEREDKTEDQAKLVSSEDAIPFPYSFAHLRVNDYDLQLLRTEATELAVQHLGVDRTRTDRFFDGILGKSLVKIIDFNHPLTLLDLQLVEDEIKKRPAENRNLTLVCLGKELAVDPWVQEYNKKHPINKIEIVELRTDKKYGRFLIHKPPRAKVEISRLGKVARIKLRNFISPTILDRLNDPEKLVDVKIADFRSMIDAVFIDNSYDGEVLDVVVSDVPKSRRELVVGNYEVAISSTKAVVAVKIVDMLGEEVIVTEEI